MTKNPTTVSRAVAFTYVTLAYLAALAGALITGVFCRGEGFGPLATVAAADAAGTIVIFLFSLAFRNSSFYDPYWSVAPIVIAGYFALMGWQAGADSGRIAMVLPLVVAWGLRLTYNWARGWRGLHQQDWRYDDLQEKTGRWYWLVSFSGIHFFPTVLVFLGCCSLYPAMALPGRPPGMLDAVALIVTLAAIVIEAVADEQLHRFVRRTPARTEKTTYTGGLWRYSRHPNYFGETAFWWGLFLFALAGRPDYWWVVAGPVSITLLFHFISIPMIDRRMRRRRVDHEQVVASVPRWIPWFPKRP